LVILGIDPGSRKIGYAFIEVNRDSISYLTSGVISLEHIPSFLDRLPEIKKRAENLLVNNYVPDEIAVESLIYVKGPTSLIKLSQARGAILASFGMRFQGKIFEYSPNLIKSMTTGFGHADKESIGKFLSMTFKNVEFQTHDESDALAIALCHASMLSRNAFLNLNKTSKSIKSKSKSKNNRSKLSENLKHRLKEQSA